MANKRSRQALFDRVRALHREGSSVSAIVRQTGFDRRTVAKWIRADALPQRNAAAPRPVDEQVPWQHLRAFPDRDHDGPARDVRHDLQQGGRAEHVIPVRVLRGQDADGATNSLNPNQNWAAFWLFSAAHAQGKDTTSTGSEWCELDIFEGWGQSIFLGTIHDWVYTTSSGLTNNQNTNNYQTLPGNPDLTQYHVYGVLWTPSAVTWYFDNAAVMSWPTYAICQSQQLFMILGAQVFMFSIQCKDTTLSITICPLRPETEKFAASECSNRPSIW